LLNVCHFGPLLAKVATGNFVWLVASIMHEEFDSMVSNLKFENFFGHCSFVVSFFILAKMPKFYLQVHLSIENLKYFKLLLSLCTEMSETF
jgi:hypothetical protein